MGKLIIEGHVIEQNIDAILTKIREQTGGEKLHDIKHVVDGVRVTCPSHKEGKESHPSCGIYVGSDEKIPWGTMHCFTCGASGPLYHFVAECFNRNDAFGKKWLMDYFTEEITDDSTCDIDEEIILTPNTRKAVPKSTSDKALLAELAEMQSWHPYMAKRKLTREVCEKFEVKYDPKTECVVFPVRDENGCLSFLTRRSVNTKKFIIDKDTDKPVYLLYDILQRGAREVYICESQINALTLRSWGYDAVALFGTGSTRQYGILNSTDILCYHLCFDGDEAGRGGILKFIRNIKNSCFIDVISIPPGKDVNDLSKDEFEKLESKDKELWLKTNN